MYNDFYQNKLPLMLARFEQQLGGRPFLVGDKLSYGDFAITAMTQYAATL